MPCRSSSSTTIPAIPTCPEALAPALTGPDTLVVFGYLPLRIQWILEDLGFDTVDARNAVASLLEYPMEFVDVGTDTIRTAYDFSAQKNHDVDDCFYIALTRRADADALCTTDTDSTASATTRTWSTGTRPRRRSSNGFTRPGRDPTPGQTRRPAAAPGRAGRRPPDHGRYCHIFHQRPLRLRTFGQEGEIDDESRDRPDRSPDASKNVHIHGLCRRRPAPDPVRPQRGRGAARAPRLNERRVTFASPRQNCHRARRQTLS